MTHAIKGVVALAVVSVCILWALPVASAPSPSRERQPTADRAAALRVEGNRLVDPAGQTVLLHGVNRSGTEYMCLGGGWIFDGPSDSPSIAAMRTWRVNAVRVPLNEDCWLGINGVPSATSGSAYQQAIADYVELLNASGIYAILELHWSAPGTIESRGQRPMPDLDHAPAFWSSVAGVFGGNGAVILELFNEPHPDGMQDSEAGWTCWRDGGTCPGIDFEVAGMQTLVDAVRSTGATNVIALGGLGWANFLSGWVMYKPNDPLHNIAAAWHTYDFAHCTTVSCYDSNVGPVAAQFPVIATEIGSNSCGAPFMETLMDWLDAHGIGYLVWTWDVWGERFGDPDACESYSLIRDYAGSPTTYGEIVREHFAQLP